MNKLSLIPEHYSPRMVAPAYATIDMPGTLTFDINRAKISEDKEYVYIQVRTTIIQLNKQTQSVKITTR